MHASLRRSPAERLEVVFEAPESLAGLRVALLPGWAEVHFQGQKLTFPSGRLPERSVAGLFGDALQRILAWEPEQLDLERREGTLFAQADGLALTAGLEEGNLLALAVLEEGLEVEVQDFQNLG